MILLEVALDETRSNDKSIKIRKINKSVSPVKEYIKDRHKISKNSHTENCIGLLNKKNNIDGGN